MPSATCAFTQRPDDKRDYASKTFFHECLAQGPNLILRNKVSDVCMGPGLWEKKGRGEKLSPPGGSN